MRVQGPYTMADYTTTTPRGLFMEARSDRHSTDAEAILYNEQQRWRRTLAPNGPSGGATDELRYTDPPDTHSLSTGGVGDVGHLAVLPPDLHSDRLPSHSAGVQRSRSGRKTKKAVRLDDAAPARKPTRGMKAGGFRDSTTQVCFRGNVWGRELNMSTHSFR